MYPGSQRPHIGMSVPGHDNFHLATQTVTAVAAAAASSSVGTELARW